jgi:hypothetical protein
VNQNLEALISIKFGRGVTLDVPKLLQDIKNLNPNSIIWVRLAFGPDADAVAYVIAADQNAVANIAIQIAMTPGVGSTSTQILAQV